METYNMLKKEIRRYIYDQNWQKFTKQLFYLQLIVLKIGKKVLR